jgi:hypothetical protein
MPSSLIVDARHNISPRLFKQLVLELDFWKLLLELGEGLPSGIIRGKTLPLHQDTPLATAELSPQHPLRAGQQATILDRRERCRGSRWWPFIGLELANVKDVVKTRAGRELKTVGHSADALQHLEGPGVARTELALGLGDEGLHGTVEKPQEHPIAHLKGHVAVMDVVVLLSVLLSLK